METYDKLRAHQSSCMRLSAALSPTDTMRYVALSHSATMLRLEAPSTRCVSNDGSKLVGPSLGTAADVSSRSEWKSLIAL